MFLNYFGIKPEHHSSSNFANHPKKWLHQRLYRIKSIKVHETHQNLCYFEDQPTHKHCHHSTHMVPWIPSQPKFYFAHQVTKYYFTPQEYR
jgi:hypothetical protein